MFLLARHVAPVLEVLVTVILLNDQSGGKTLRAVLRKLSNFCSLGDVHLCPLWAMDWGVAGIMVHA